MKTYFTYGFGITLGSVFLMLVLYLLGYHTVPEKFVAGQIIGGVGSGVVTAIGIVLAMKAVRSESADQSLSYGRSIGVGTVVTLIAGILTAGFALVYGTTINPTFHDLIYDTQVARMADRGMTSAQIEQASRMMKFFTGATWTAIAQLLFSPVVGAVLSLVLGFFVKRAPLTAPPKTS